MYTNREERLNPIAVITATKSQYDHFINNSGVSISEKEKFVWIATEAQTTGKRFSHVIRLSGYREIPYWQQLYRIVVANAAHGQA